VPGAALISQGAVTPECACAAASIVQLPLLDL
jgi:hypothetical protein